MADQPSYPQIPSNVWWGVRSILNRNPRSKLDETTLAIQLQVQPAAARQYLAELKRLGLLTDEGSATDLALRWRMDETYREATSEMLRAAYPEQLVDLAPPGSTERSKVENWFMMKGLGQGTAKNKAATYMLLASGDPTTAQLPRQGGATQTSAARTPKAVPAADQKTPKPEAKQVKRQSDGRANSADLMPLNVNVQIHISADATSDQIETIFSAMRKYLHGDATV